jgi:hypothetical protein
MNVVFLSMPRCGISWVGDVIKHIYERLYGKPLEINYENDRVLISRTLVKGWHSVYDIDPKVLINLGYDKIIIVKRELEAMKEAHAFYQGYMENYGTLENMKKERPGFFERLELYYKLIYEQNEVINHPNVLIVNLEDLNDYTYATFNEIIKFLNFKLSFIQKLRLFSRVLKNKIMPFVVPVNPSERNWNINSAMLPKGQELCLRLQYLKKIEVKR